MKKFSVVFSAFVLLLGLSGAAGAYTINYAYVLGGPTFNEFTSPWALTTGFITENFNPPVTPGALPATGLTWTWSGDGQVVSGQTSDYAPPFGFSSADGTQYVSVPINTEAPNTATADLKGSYNYLGLWWGSIDEYNTLELYKGTSLVANIPGGDLAPANGNQTEYATNHYVNIYTGLDFFDNFKMTSTNFAFEADNFTAGVVPEPGTMMLLGSGLIGLAGWGRKKFRK